METAICDNCGQEVEEWTLKVFNLGKIQKRLCPDCYKHGTRDAVSRTCGRVRQIVIEEEKQR